MKLRLTKLAGLGLMLMALAALPTRRVQAGPQAIATAATSIQTAPALVQDSAEALRRALLARLEFEELNMQLVGVARFSGEDACTIKHPNAPEPMLYRIGDVVGGYRIIGIDQTSVTFERNDLKFYLTAGESSNGADIAASDGDQPESLEIAQPSAADGARALTSGLALDRLAPDAALVVKTAADNLKLKTGRFQTAKLIEEVDGDAAHAQLQPQLRSSMFALPLASYRFTSPFGYRKHPLGGGIRFHRGVDLAAPLGTSILAAADGVVEKSAWTPAIGNDVTIDHGGGYSTRYGHMSRRLVQEGDKVKQGDVIGRVGSTGESTGNHVHFEIRKNDVALDPEAFLKIHHTVEFQSVSPGDE